ncbi:hypothetical protein O6H91_04G075200 [Diphasiastrum complanatum]|uniref:Uncharacterized protein n=1 Tax=Diphasiastrum complanatum TaxID=34168 RepID=A0ACC2DY49_DIPCM|nr:hypothetical protein O6H91_04G075200 [Diphasiastrum complanatum]
MQVQRGSLSATLVSFRIDSCRSCCGSALCLRPPTGPRCLTSYQHLSTSSGCLQFLLLSIHTCLLDLRPSTDLPQPVLGLCDLPIIFLRLSTHVVIVNRRISVVCGLSDLLVSCLRQLVACTTCLQFDF